MSLLLETLACPVCNLPLNRNDKNCEFCFHFERAGLEIANNIIDLIPKRNTNKKPLRTEIFRSFWISFFYEKILPPIWALGLRDFGGIDREIESVIQ